MSIKHIENLSINPFFASKILQHFISGSKEHIVGLELIYLVLPFVYYEDTRKLLIKANIKSDIYTLFKGDIHKQASLSGLLERIDYFKKLTNQSLIVGHNESRFLVSNNLILMEKVDYRREKNLEVREYFRAAHYLGIVLSKYENKEIFIKIGVTV